MATGDDVYTYSVVVPVYNEAGTIKTCLDSLLDADYPNNAVEILVADGGSEDETREIVASYADSTEPIELLDNPGKTTPHGFNVGIEASSNEIITLISGHSRVDPDFFRELSAAFDREPDADVVGGVMVPEATGYTQRVVSAALTTPLGSSSSRFEAHEGYVETVNFGAYRRHVVESVGLFDTGLPRAQDYEYNRRVRRERFRIYQTPDVRVYYTPRSSFAGLARQYYGNGYWKAVVHDRYDDLPASPAVLTGGGILGAVGGLLAVATRHAARFGLAVLAACYGLALVWAAGNASDTDDLAASEYPGVVVAIATIHLCYGAGITVSVATLASQTEDAKRRTDSIAEE
jgi:glycosyltransferase involved in cell wall biosynthesis